MGEASPGMENYARHRSPRVLMKEVTTLLPVHRDHQVYAGAGSCLGEQAADV